MEAKEVKVEETTTTTTTTTTIETKPETTAVEPTSTTEATTVPPPTTTTTTTTNSPTPGNVKRGPVRTIPMPSTVMEALEYTSSKHPNLMAMRVKRDKVWKSWTWQQYRNDVLIASKSILSLGVHSRSGVNIIGFNSPEWHIAYLGAIHCNALPTGVYTTSSPSQCEYFAAHSDAQIVFCEDVSQLNKYISIRDKLPNIKACVIMDPVPGQIDESEPSSSGKESETTNAAAASSSKSTTVTPATMAHRYQGFVYTWEQFMALGKNIEDSELDKHSKLIKPNDLATLIYTSGTTSLPKGVMLTHTNVLWTVHTIGYEVVNVEAPHTERIISYLPLSHIAEQIVSLYAPIVFGFPVSFAEKTALSGTLLDTLQEVRPTIFFGVPRVWEKIQVKIQSLLAQKGGIGKKIVSWAQKKGIEGGYKVQKGEKRPMGYGIANALVFKKVIKNLGLEQCKLLASAAAPISIDTLEFFLGLGITVCEAYGMSELSGPQSVGYPLNRTGSVGRTMPGSEVIVDTDGEILVRGPNCFIGYYKNEEASKETIDKDGWIHTGDVGHIDKDGFIFITDRKKELIITAGGENISPTLIEGFIRQIIGVEQAVVIGDRQKYLVALVTVNSDLFKLLPGQGYTHPLPKSMEEASTDKNFIAYIDSQMKDINSKLPNVSTIKKVKILPIEFQETGEASELTPTKKLKRRNIGIKYQNEIKELYGADFVDGGFKSTSTSNNDKKDESSSTVIPVNKETITPIIINQEKVDEKSTVVEEKPTVVEEKPTVIEDKPTIVEEKPTVIEEKPTIVEEEKTIVVEEKPIVEEEKKVVVEEKIIVEEEKKVVDQQEIKPVTTTTETSDTTVTTTLVPVVMTENIAADVVEDKKPEESTTETTVTQIESVNTIVATATEGENDKTTVIATEEQPSEPPKLKEDVQDNKENDTSSSSVSSTTTSSINEEDDSSSTSSDSTSSLSNSKDENNKEETKEEKSEN
ncbi:hypothetical protein ACTA71_010171 [Dictyostelium dimigraforme]